MATTKESTARRAAPSRIWAVRLGLLLPVLAAAVTVVIWRGVEAREARSSRQQVRLVTRQAALRLEDYVRARLLVVQSVTDAVASGALVDEANFVSYTNALQAQLGGFLAINRVAADGRIVWVSPPEPNRSARGKNVLRHPDAGRFARLAFTRRSVEVTAPIALFQGMRGFASYFPVVDAAGTFDGAVNGVFDADKLVREALRSGLLEGYEVRISDDGADLFLSEGFEGAETQLSAQQKVEVLGRRWTVELRPRPSTVAGLRPGSHNAWALLGLGACLVLGALGLAWTRAMAQADLLAADQERLQNELRQAQKMEALGRLAGGLAHDFNNLLTALRGHAELALITEDLDADARLSLEDILSATQRGAEMTRGLLAFSRKRPAQVKRVDPGQQVRSLQRTLRHLVRESIYQEVELVRGEGVVEMDPTQLDQVVMNLVVNAVDAMPEGGRLRVQLRVQDPSWFLLEVEDTGVGIPREVLDQVFEPFFTTKAEAGTGLGLAQVWDFVHRAAGRVEVESEPGEGTNVKVWLPRLEGAPDEAVQSSGNHPAPVGSVLLVEDDPEIRDTLGRFLRRSGFTVQVASTVVEGMEIAVEGPGIDAVVSDVQLPDGTGPELGERLRERAPDLPLVFCSGNARAEDAERIEALGAAFFAKPFSAQDLVNHLAEVVAEVHRARSSHG